MSIGRHIPGNGKRISYYGFGRTTAFACQAEPRCSYCMYVPRAFDEESDRVWPLAIMVHGTGRTNTAYRDAMVNWAEAEGCIILAPLFPSGIIEPGDLNNYKWIRFHDMRFDLILLAMVDEIAALYPIDRDNLLLHGFSGGGHYAHRFAYLHPQRLLGVSIGAPGAVTLLDTTRPWWVGVADIEQQFGIPLDLDAMRRVPAHFIVGGDDTDTWEITIPESSPRWVPDANMAGRTRIDRISTLRDSFDAADIETTLDIVPGYAHAGMAMLPPVQAFFSAQLARWREERSG